MSGENKVDVIMSHALNFFQDLVFNGGKFGIWVGNQQ